jgi:hypothetical protein
MSDRHEDGALGSLGNRPLTRDILLMIGNVLLNMPIGHSYPNAKCDASLIKNLKCRIQNY